MEEYEQIHSTMLERVHGWKGSSSDRLQRMGDDMAFWSGQQWDEQVRSDRGEQQCLVVDKTAKIVRAICAPLRREIPGLSVSPVSGDPRLKATAAVYEGLLRAIMSTTKARKAVVTAGESAVTTGYGYLQVCYDYASPNSMDYALRIKTIEDPRLVAMDNADCPEWGAVMVALDKNEAEKMYGEITDSSLIPDSYLADWADSDKVIIAEYYYLEHTEATLYEIQTPEGRVKTTFDVTPSDLILRERKSDRIICKQAIASGAGIIEVNDYPGGVIPIIPFYGETILIDDRIEHGGMVRRLMDAQRLINYYKSTEAEIVATQQVRVPFIMAQGQDAGFEQEWNEITTANRAYVRYNPVDSQGKPMPPPFKPDISINTNHLSIAAQNSTTDLSDISGVYDAQLGNIGNEKSGKAILTRSAQSQETNHVWLDEIRFAIERLGNVIIKMIPEVYADQNILRILSEDANEDIIITGAPEELKVPGTDIVGKIDLTLGDYEVTVKAGSSYASRRAESSSAMIEMMTILPDDKKSGILDLIVEQQDWPGARRIANRLKKLLPPELQDDNETEDPQATAIMQQMQQSMAQAEEEANMMAQQLEQAMQTIQQMQLALIAADADQSAKIAVANINASAKIEAEQIKAGVSLENNAMQTEAELAIEAARLQQKRAEEARKHAVKLAEDQMKAQAEMIRSLGQSRDISGNMSRGQYPTPSRDAVSRTTRRLG
jgi:hypothetical protein